MPRRPVPGQLGHDQLLKLCSRSIPKQYRHDQLHELRFGLLLYSDGGIVVEHLFELRGGNLRFGHGVDWLLNVRDRELLSCCC